MIKGFRHTGIVVRDLEKSIVFYQSLCFELHTKNIEQGSSVEQIVNIQNVKLETAKLSAPGNSNIELLQYHSHPSEATIKKHESNELGCSHIALTVEDIEQFLNKVEENGGSKVNPPSLSKNKRFLVAYCHDPEGVLLEIVQELGI